MFFGTQCILRFSISYLHVYVFLCSQCLCVDGQLLLDGIK